MTDYQHLDAQSRLALRRHYVGENARLVAEVILDCSYAMTPPRDTAIIPRLHLFQVLTGIPVANVSRAIAALESMRILQERTPPGYYTFLPDSEQWKTRPRTDSIIASLIQRFLRGINSGNPHQLELLPPDPDLHQAIAAVSRERASEGAEFGVQSSKFKVEECGRRLSAPIPGTFVDESTTLPLNVLSASEILPGESGAVNTLTGGSGGAGVDESSRRAREADRMDRLTAVMGATAMRDWGGRWRNRCRQFPGVIEKVLAEAKVQREMERAGTSRKVVRSWGPWLNDLFERFARYPHQRDARPTPAPVGNP